jgi:hypothetical protein
MITPGDLWHLAKRWWLAITVDGPGADEEAWATSFLTASQSKLWLQLQAQDRSHSILVAQRFVAVRPEATRAEMAAALLHDVGKVASPLSTWSRVGATVVPLWLVPQRGPCRELRSRWEAYRDHERLGIEMLGDVGAETETIDLLKGLGPAARDLAKADRI